MTTNEFLRRYRKEIPLRHLPGWFGSEPKLYVRPRAVMKDGFSISIQANDCAYCHPRTSFDTDYTEVELGFPSAADELIVDEYAEDPTDPTETVYAYVPVEIVDQLVEKHGGIDIEATEAAAKERPGFNWMFE